MTKEDERPQEGGLSNNSETLHAPSGETSEGWYIREGELKPDQLRKLGHLLYLFLFDEEDEECVPGKERENLRRNGGYKKDPESFPAELYVDNFASKHGLTPQVFKRWANAASLEIARACLPVFAAKKNDDIKKGVLSAPRWGGNWAEYIGFTRRVARKGINASLRDHLRLVTGAQDIGEVPHSHQEMTTIPRELLEDY